MTKYTWFDLGNGRQVYRRVPDPVETRSHLPAPMVISDTMPETEHVDGKFYTSKSAYRRVTRANGYVEVGTEKLKPFVPQRPDRKGIRDALIKAKTRLSV